MNTNDLKIFEAVATSESFTKAASAMYTVQSNVTARIKTLEEELGAELFLRTSRKVMLTPAGNMLLQYSKQIGHLIDQLKSEVKSSDTISGRLRVGCIETTMALKVPEMLNYFEENYPGVELEFKSEPMGQLIKDVMNYKLDAAFVSARVNVAGLNHLKISKEKLVIISASNGPSLNELIKQEPLKLIVFDEGCFFRSRLESWLSSKGIMHYKNTTLNSIEGIINFVEAGLGISLLPEQVITGYYSKRKIRCHRFNKQLETMNTALIFRKDIFQSKALDAFIAMCRKP